jgi:phytoene dehydrogenase-like protein
MARLEAETPSRAPDAMLLDRNLVIESGVSRATLARSDVVMSAWRSTKERAVVSALETLRVRQTKEQHRQLTDSDLLQLARIDAAALARMSAETLKIWENLKREGPGRPRPRFDSTSQSATIDSLLAKLYALTLAVRQREETIAELKQEISALKESSKA